MAQTGFAKQIRQAFIALSAEGRLVHVKDIAIHLDMITDKEKQRLYRAVKDFKRRGEVEMFRPGVYHYQGREDTKRSLLEAMHAVVRMKKTVSIADLQELAGASYEYAKEFLGAMKRRGVVQRVVRPGGSVVFRLVNDLGPEPPEMSEKAAKLKRIREEKKKALDMIDQAASTLMDVARELPRLRMVVNDIPEDEV